MSKARTSVADVRAFLMRSLLFDDVDSRVLDAFV